MISNSDKKFFKLAVGQQAIGKESDVDISARCPVCGDSKTNSRLKRLHLYAKGNETRVNCFNGDCPVNNRTMYGFLRDHYPALIEQYKRENFTNTLNNLSNGLNEDVFGGLKKHEKHDTNDRETKDEILTQDLSPFFKDIRDVHEGIGYLRNRGYIYNEQKYGKWYFGYQDLKIGENLYKITNAVIIPLYYKNQMYGFYSRNIYDKTFYTYMHDANIGYKIWNWFNIDKSKPVYIFEGIFDAIASGIDNIVALMGAKIPKERLIELKKPVFVLDNDKTGLMNSIEYSKNSYVYIQPDKYIEKDMNELHLKYPLLNIPELIRNNIFNGISAQVRIKAKL